MTAKPRHLQQVLAHGSPRDAGRAIGASGAADVRRVVQRVQEQFERLCTTDERRRRLAHYRTRMCGYLERHFPGELEEMRGIADGAGVAPEDAVMLSLGPCLGELLFDVPHHCSSIAWNSEAQGPTLFKTDDGPAYDGSRPLEAQIDGRIDVKRVFDVQSGKALRCLGITDIGRVISETGVNDAGLAMGSSSGRPVLAPQDGAGIPQHMFPGLVLRYCRDVDEAIAFAHKHPLAGKGINIAIADAGGNLAAIEKCGSYVGVRRSRAWAFCVNHYLDPAMHRQIEKQAPDFIGSKYHRNSEGRRIFLEARLPKMAAMDDADADAVVATLFEHDTAGSVCQHTGGNDLGTNFAVRIRPAERTIDLWHGPPCLGDARWYTFAVAPAGQPA